MRRCENLLVGTPLVLGLVCSLAALAATESHARDAEPEKPPVELVGRVSDFWFHRNWATYYWREDFTFMLTEEGADGKPGKTWRIISREPTPAYVFRMGTTFTGLAVDWKMKPRVKVLGVQGIDRIPVDFYDFKLNEPNLATALAVYVDAGKETWKPYYINNWVHKWGDKADKMIAAHYADKPVPYDIYGFVNGQAAPFDAKSQKIIADNRANPSLMFHGRYVTSKNVPFGYEIQLIDLVGRDVKTGGHTMLFGDAKTIPLLDNKKPK